MFDDVFCGFKSVHIRLNDISGQPRPSAALALGLGPDDSESCQRPRGHIDEVSVSTLTRSKHRSGQSQNRSQLAADGDGPPWTLLNAPNHYVMWLAVEVSIADFASPMEVTDCHGCCVERAISANDLSAPSSPRSWTCAFQSIADALPNKSRMLCK